MTNPSPILGNESRPLLAGLGQAGVALGSEVVAAQKAQREAFGFLLPYQQAAENALADLQAPGGNFAKQSTALVKATAELQAASAANGAVQSAAETNLLGAINANVGDYEAQLVQMFSAIVAQHRLNELAPALPDFSVDGFKLDVLSLTASQADAVLAWKRSAGQLHGVWEAYTRLAKFRGYTLGPVGDSLWSNRLTAACLGAVTAAHTMTVATVFAAWDAGVESSRQIRPLLPFVAAAISGFELQLVPVDEADARLRSFGQVQTPGGIPVGVS